MNGVSATPRAASRESRKIPPSGGVLRFCTYPERSSGILNKNAKQPERGTHEMRSEANEHLMGREAGPQALGILERTARTKYLATWGLRTYISRAKLGYSEQKRKTAGGFLVRHIAEDGCELQKMKVNL